MGKDKSVRRWATFSSTLLEYLMVKGVQYRIMVGNYPSSLMILLFFKINYGGSSLSSEMFVRQVIEHHILGRSI